MEEVGWSVVVVLGCAASVAWTVFRRRKRVHAQVYSTRWVAPDAAVREKLSAWDERMALYDSAIHIVLRFEQRLDPDACFRGFQKLAHAQPLLASRYHKASSELVLSPSSCGALFQVAACPCKDKSLLPDNTSTSSAWRAAGLTALTPTGIIGSEFGPSDALVRARITLCPHINVSYLALCVSHILCDGQNVVELLHLWAQLSSERKVDGGVAPPPTTTTTTTTKPRWRKSAKVIKDQKQLDAWWEMLRCTKSPTGLGFRVWSCLVTLPQILAGLIINRAHEWKLSGQALRELKSHASKRLLPGEWVSSYEVLFSALICAHERAHGRKQSRFALSAVVNMRGRHTQLEKDYFGNASAPLDVGAVDIIATENDFLADIVHCAVFIHNSIRSGIQDPSKMRGIHEWADAARALGIKPMFYPEFCQAVAGRGAEINSWSSYPWLDINFGDSGKPSCISVPYQYVPRGVWLQLPFNHQDSLLLLSLPEHIARKMIQQLNSLPLGEDLIKPI